MSEKTVRCTDCRCEFTDEELEDVTECPKCGSKGVPMIIAEDVEIKINLHELRILTIWASNWAEQAISDDQGTRTLNGILNALRPQLPEGTPLTMKDEFHGVANALGTEVEVHRADGTNEKIKPETRH